MNAINELINKLEINKTDFSRKARIPYRTIQDWAMGNRKPTEYLTNLLNYRFEDIIYTSTEYRVYNLKDESVTTKNITEVKSILNEEALSDAELLIKYANKKDVSKPYIEYECWIVKKNLIGEYQYTMYIDNGKTEGMTTNDLKEAIRVAEQHAFIF